VERVDVLISHYKADVMMHAPNLDWDIDKIAPRVFESFSKPLNSMNNPSIIPLSALGTSNYVPGISFIPSLGQRSGC